MIPSEAKSANVQAMLNAKNCANTADATSGWIDTRGMQGSLLVIQNVGAVTGNIAGALKTSSESNGANNEAITFDDGNNFALVSAANNTQAKTIDARKSKGWIGYVGTIGTGPAVVSVAVIGRPRESA